MKPPSRRMQKMLKPKTLGWFGTGVFILMLLAFPAFFIWAEEMPLWLSCYLSLTVFSGLLIAAFEHNKKAKKTAAERKEESICTFARQLNCREVDTWIIRAVYEELLEYFGYPPHLDDRFDKIDSYDVSDIANSIAVRIGRPLKDLESNPYMGKVDSVRELILFFTAQPLDMSQITAVSAK